MRFQEKRLRLKTEVISLCSGVVIFIIGALLAINTVSSFEISVLKMINSWPDTFELYFSIISFGGTLLFTICMAMFFWITKKKLVAIEIVLAGIISWVVTTILKTLEIRLRPQELINWVHVREHADMIAGYPSGHAAIATSVSLITYKYLPKRYRPIVLLLVFLVFISRLYLGIHFPLDIIGGIGVGLFVASSINITMMLIGPHKKARVYAKK